MKVSLDLFTLKFHLVWHHEFKLWYTFYIFSTENLLCQSKYYQQSTNLQKLINNHFNHLSPVKRICVFEHSVMTILTAHAQPFRGARDLALSEGSSWLAACMSKQGRFWETAQTRRLAWTFAARIGDKYQIRLMRPIWATAGQNQQNDLCTQGRRRSALMSLHCELVAKCCRQRSPGWSESDVPAAHYLLALSSSDSFL